MDVFSLTRERVRVWVSGPLPDTRTQWRRRRIWIRGAFGRPAGLRAGSGLPHSWHQGTKPVLVTAAGHVAPAARRPEGHFAGRVYPPSWFGLISILSAGPAAPSKNAS